MKLTLEQIEEGEGPEWLDEIRKRHDQQHPLYLDGLTLDAVQAHKDRANLLAEVDRLRAELDSREIQWAPIHEAPTDGRKIIIGNIAKFVHYKDPAQMGGRKGRWQVRDDYGNWSNCDRKIDYYIDGYKLDRRIQ